MAVSTIDRTRTSLILIHGGENHYPSRLALNKWRSVPDYTLREIEVVDNRVKQWLRHNSQGIVVTEVPCILLCRADHQTMIYGINRLNDIIEQISLSKNGDSCESELNQSMDK